MRRKLRRDHIALDVCRTQVRLFQHIGDAGGNGRFCEGELRLAALAHDVVQAHDDAVTKLLDAGRQPSCLPPLMT